MRDNAAHQHHYMMATLGYAKSVFTKKKGKAKEGGEATALEILSWRPKFSVKRYSPNLETEKDIFSSIGWKLRNPRVIELFANRKVVYNDSEIGL